MTNQFPAYSDLDAEEGQLQQKARELPNGAYLLQFFISYIDVYFRLFLYQLVLNVSQSFWISLCAWIACIILRQPLISCFLQSPMSARCKICLLGVISLACLIGLALQTGSFVLFFIYIFLDFSVSSLYTFLEQQLLVCRHDLNYLLQLDYCGYIMGYLSFFYLILEQQGASDRLRPCISIITYILSAFTLLIMMLYRPYIGHWVAAQSSNRDIQYFAILCLELSSNAIMFYCPVWIWHYYYTKKLGSSALQSTVLAMCLLYIGVNVFSFIVNSFKKRIVKIMFYLTCALGMTGLMVVCLQHKLKVWHQFMSSQNLYVLFATMMLALMWGELVKRSVHIFIQVRKNQQREIRSLVYVLLFGILPAFMSEAKQFFLLAVAAAAVGVLLINIK